MERSSSFSDGQVRDQLPSFFQINSKNGQRGVAPFDGQHIVTILAVPLHNCDDGLIWNCQDVLGIRVLGNRTGCSSEKIRVSNHSTTSFPDFRRGGRLVSDNHAIVFLFASKLTQRRVVVYAGNP